MLLKIKSVASQALTTSMRTDFCDLLNSRDKSGYVIREIKRGTYPGDLKAYKDSLFNRRRHNCFLASFPES